MVRSDFWRILVIRHGALGDFVLSFAAFAAIRARHPGAEISLLTTSPFVALAGAAPWFDRVLCDAKPGGWDLPGLLRLRRQLGGFDFVYDLQTSGRSSGYFRLMGRKPGWSGIAVGCSHPHADAGRDELHTRERLAGQLRDAGIPPALPVPELGWLRGADVGRFGLPGDYVAVIPGAAAHRPEKRWPYFAEFVEQAGRDCVVVGAASEGVGRGIDLTGKTDLFELAAVLAGARLAVGNDTGPMHMAAALGVPCVVLFSGASDPALTAPRYLEGGWPVILRETSLADLPVARVLAALP